MNIPKVSVVTITYGHQDYILDTINSVISQQYDGEIEFIISNDNSPDNTDEIIREYLQSNIIPNNIKIRYTKHEKNLGMMPNFIWTLRQCTGEYIALCEGDDYWIDPLKLQKQVDFLEENEDYVIHSAKAKVLKVNSCEIIGNPLNKNTYKLSDFYTKNNLITCTILFKKIEVDFKSLEKILFGDWSLYVLILNGFKDKKAFVSDEIYSVYRVHDGGITNSLKSILKNAQEHYNQILLINNIINTSYNENDILLIKLYSTIIYKHLLYNREYIQIIKHFFSLFFLLKFDFPFRQYLFLFRYKDQLKDEF